MIPVFFLLLCSAQKVADEVLSKEKVGLAKIGLSHSLEMKAPGRGQGAFSRLWAPPPGETWTEEIKAASGSRTAGHYLLLILCLLLFS